MRNQKAINAILDIIVPLTLENLNQAPAAKWHDVGAAIAKDLQTTILWMTADEQRALLDQYIARIKDRFENAKTSEKAEDRLMVQVGSFWIAALLNFQPAKVSGADSREVAPPADKFLSFVDEE